MKRKAPSKKKPQKRAIDKKPAFLAAFIQSASLTVAAEAAGVDRNMHYRWLADDPKYAADYAAAREQAAQTLEDSAVEWALKGIFEPLVYQGGFCYAQCQRVLCLLPDEREVYADEFTTEELAAMQVQSRRTVTENYGPPLGVFRRSEGLHARLLKAFMPARYADRGAVEVSGPNGAPIENTLTVTFVQPKDEAAK